MFKNITWYCSSSLPRKPLEDGCGCLLGIMLRRRQRFPFGWRRLAEVAECRPEFVRKCGGLKACCSWRCWLRTYRLVLGQQSCKADCVSFRTLVVASRSFLRLYVVAHSLFCTFITPISDSVLFPFATFPRSVDIFSDFTLRTLSFSFTSLPFPAPSSFSRFLLLFSTTHPAFSFSSQDECFLPFSSAPRA